MKLLQQLGALTTAKQKRSKVGQWFGSVATAVASDTRDPRFESSHQQMLLTINGIEKIKIK